MLIRGNARRNLALFAIGVFIFGTGSVIWAQGATKSPDYKELQLFRRVMGIVQKNYVKDVADKELIQGAINGMLQSLDPHSSYLTEDQFKELQVETKGEFGGLGIEITLENGVLTIVSPIEDTPAFREGLKPGDKIIKINGESTKNITLMNAVKKMRGPQGTKVTITIMRDGWKKFKDFTITRDKIKVHSVKKELVEAGYPYLRIVNFQDRTDEDLQKAIVELGGEDKVKGVILDLRNNPGGLLDEAVKVSDLFVENGLIVYTDGKAKDQQMELQQIPRNTSLRSQSLSMRVAQAPPRLSPARCRTTTEVLCLELNPSAKPRYRPLSLWTTAAVSG